MNNNNLIFSSNIDPQIEDNYFDILAQHLSEQEFEKVYVTNVALAPDEILFFAKINDKESIIRIRVEND